MSTPAIANLETATRDLLLAWERAQETWRDGKSREFGETFAAPLTDLTSQGRHAMEHLESLLRKIKHDCE